MELPSTGTIVGAIRFPSDAENSTSEAPILRATTFALDVECYLASRESGTG